MSRLGRESNAGENLIFEQIVYVLLGVFVAGIATMVGIGGGVFFIPIFYLFLGLNIENAIATSKFIITFVSLTGAINYFRAGKVPLKLSLYVLATMIPFSYIGATISTDLSDFNLSIVVAVFIIYYSIRLLYKTIRIQRINSDPLFSIQVENLSARTSLLAVLSGSLSGFIAGLTGTGGGVVNMPLFLALLGLPVHNAVALSTFVIFPSAIIATVRHILDHKVIYDIALPFTIGAVAGAFIGPRLAIRLEARKLRFFIAVVILLVGLRMLFNALYLWFNGIA